MSWVICISTPKELFISLKIAVIFRTIVSIMYILQEFNNIINLANIYLVLY